MNVPFFLQHASCYFYQPSESGDEGLWTTERAVAYELMSDRGGRLIEYRNGQSVLWWYQ